MVWPDRFSLMEPARQLACVARLIRDFHDAVQDFTPPSHGFIPLSAHPDWQSPDPAGRLRVFADAYGLAESERRRLVPVLGRRTRSMHDLLRDQAAQGAQPWARMWAEGHGDAWRNDAEYIEQREDQWRQALLAG
ncbi:hypothetical protein ACH5AI_16560 [Streptomyces collinus]|uniref:hypothetical protein n=1 Tax=Streptomyces collinus TaxID=42684 RepID=UPI00379D7CB4